MKIILNFKTPDVSCQLEEEAYDASADVRERFILNDEFIKIEFDTVTETAKVLEVPPGWKL